MRKPAVADRFYPGNKESMTQTLHDLFKEKPASNQATAAKAVISPHAGYIFSGQLAARTLASVKIPETVVILGPNHHGIGKKVAVSAENWQMPCGIAPINQAFVASLLERGEGLISVDEAAHQAEHSLEVQVPLLQHLQPKVTIVPIVISRLSYDECQHLASLLAETILPFDTDVLILASSDMNHFESQQENKKKDQKALDQIDKMNPLGLYDTVFKNRISMCGVIPAVVSMIASQSLGATTSRLVGYTDSSVVSGDSDSVVGYAGVVFS